MGDEADAELGYWLAQQVAKSPEGRRRRCCDFGFAGGPEIDSFCLVEGVWVAASQCAIPVGLAIREILVSAAAARQIGEGQQTKTELVYQYLTGQKFHHRIEAIVEQFTEMQADLDRERKAMTKLWARREQQIRCVVESTAGMYGDLQGITGQSIQEIEGLDFRLLKHDDKE